MRILFLAHRIPFPPNKGDKVRAYHEVKLFARRHEVHLLALSEERGDLVPPAGLLALCARVEIAHRTRLGSALRGLASLAIGRSYSEGAFASPRLRRLAAREADSGFDAVFAFSSSMAPLALAARARRRVLDLVDVDSEKIAAYARSARFPRRQLYALEARRLRALERESLSQFDACVVVSPEEARLAERLFPGERPPVAVENGVDSDAFAPPSRLADEPGIVFTGAMDYPPNADAAVFFAREVLPLVLAEVKEARFAIVGREPPRSVRALAGGPVTVTGTVPDVRPHLASARVAVAPLRIARGVQNKILEAMAAGVPVVASAEAAKGIDAEDGEFLLVARDAASFATAVVRLLTDRPLAERLRRAARARIEERYSWDKNLAPLLDLLEPEAAPREKRTAPEGSAP